jgi:ABC-2 type transport system permease protein
MFGWRIFVAFFFRRFRVERSYKFTFFLQLLSVAFSVAVYFFINRLFGDKIPGALAIYNTDYFQYSLVGLAINTWLISLAYSGSTAITEEMRNGTLDFLLLSPAPKLVTFFALNSWAWFYETGIMALYFIAGAVFFKAGFAAASIPLFLLALFLAFICFTGINLLSSAFLMVFKRGNIVGWGLGGVMLLWGDVYFPITLLPENIRILADFIPLDNILILTRLALFNPAAIPEIQHHLFAVGIWGSVLLVAGLGGLSAALHYARRNGTLNFI